MIAETDKNGVQFSFLDIDCVAVRSLYKNSMATALEIVAADTQNNKYMGITAGEPVCRASINIDAPALGPDEVAIKTYSENQGLLPLLIAAKIVTLTNTRIGTPYGLLPVVTINSEKLAEL